MSVRFTGGQTLSTTSTGAFLTSTVNFGVSVWFKLVAAGTGWTTLDDMWEVNGNNLAIKHQQQGDGTAWDQVGVPFRNIDIVAGTVYHYLYSSQSGNQQVWINGTNYAIGTDTGTTGVGAGKVWLGDVLAVMPGDALVDIEAIAGWNSYSPTSADDAAIRGGTLPTALSTPADWYYPLTIPGGKSAGNAVVNGDSTLADTRGFGTPLVIAGAPVYSAALAPSSGGPSQLSQIYLTQVADLT